MQFLRLIFVEKLQAPTFQLTFPFLIPMLGLQATNQQMVSPNTLRRHCIGPTAERLCTGRERLTHSAFLTAVLRAMLLASGEGDKQPGAHRHMLIMHYASVWQVFCLCVSDSPGRCPTSSDQTTKVDHLEKTTLSLTRFSFPNTLTQYILSLCLSFCLSLCLCLSLSLSHTHTHTHTHSMLFVFHFSLATIKMQEGKTTSV